MSDDKQRTPGEENGTRGRKPRGLGGVILILALLMALFVVVSRGGMDSDASVDGFFIRLFDGEIRTYPAEVDGLLGIALAHFGRQRFDELEVSCSRLRG